MVDSDAVVGVAVVGRVKDSNVVRASYRDSGADRAILTGAVKAQNVAAAVEETKAKVVKA